MAIHLLGIRHHGPGSARNVRTFLNSVQPDIVLVEGPPEADGLLKWVGHPELKPPVAMLCYAPEDMKRSVFYPFAEFSPEWQAILYAQTRSIPVRFIDLPISNQFELEKAESAEPKEPTGPAEAPKALPFRPTALLAQAAGHEDEEKWWEHMFENRAGSEPVFDAMQEAMEALREPHPENDDKREILREAYMRQSIRAAQREMYTTIAVICGAWHVPALNGTDQKDQKQKEDTALLKGLPKIKTECTWIPWTYHRLSYYSGYGAGIFSPGWYDHLWNYPEDDGTRWISKVASLFRENKMDVSSAHVIETVRLSQALTAMRNLSRPGLQEMNEAILSVICQGEEIKLNLIHEKLIVSDRIGEVPAEAPKPPLQIDIEKLQKRLRLPATADWKDYTLDLRKDTDLERSTLLRRLSLLGIHWGIASQASGKGTFKEQWRLQWNPSFSIDIIEKGSYGNTVEEAASKYVISICQETTSLKEVASLLENTLPADLPGATDALIHQIDNLSAASGDVIQLMEVVPGLVTVSRYGNVRKTDAEQVRNILDSMITRICISLPSASTAIDAEAAAGLLDLIAKMNDALNILQDEEAERQWTRALQKISGASNNSISPLVAGYATRLLTDHKVLEGEALIRAFSYAMSTASDHATAAAWLEGFLKGSGSLLLVDNDLWNVVYEWVGKIDTENFTDILPLLRRSFAHFSQPERRKLGEKVKTGNNGPGIKQTEAGFDGSRAAKGIPVVLQLLGINNKE